MQTSQVHNKGNFGQAALMAAAYAVAGLIGLQLAMPPGYATLIWPASGIAVSGLLLFGPKLWPGIFVGSFIINAHVGGAFLNDTMSMQPLLMAAGIAAGSSLQSLSAAMVLRWRFGIPIALKRWTDIPLFVLVAGPLPCLVSATIGVTILAAAGKIPAGAVLQNWAIWWLGDLIGIVVVLPIALLGPWRSSTILWLGRPIERFSSASLLVLLVPLILTFYGWYWTSHTVYQRNQTAFAALAAENEHSLIHRLDSYSYGLDGAAGLMQASDRVTLDEWRTYVATLGIAKNFPGINGIGIIHPVERPKLGAFLDDARADGVRDLVVHPDTGSQTMFVIRYIEPVAANMQAVGLDIAFENNRRQAAITARDTGQPTITKRITLVQDATRSAGFLLLRPVYSLQMPTNTVEERRAAFRGWVYAPFIGPKFMTALSVGQGDTIDIEIFDGSEINESTQIYSSRDNERALHQPDYSLTKKLQVRGQTWTVVWSSTPKFEAKANTKEGWLVFAAGGVLTFLFGAYLLSFVRREEVIQSKVVQKTREIVARDEQTRSMVETAVVAIVLFDEKGRALSANSAAEKMFGFLPNRLSGASIDVLIQIGETDSPEDMLSRLSAIESKNTHDAQTICGRHQRGHELKLDLQVNPWNTADGEKRYTAIIRDVSDQERIRRELQETEERWSIALESANIGVFDIDLISGKSIVSDTWRSMLGFELGEEIVPQTEWLNRVHPDDLPAVRAADQACFNSETPRSESEYRIRHKDGHWIWLRSEAVVKDRDRNGQPVRFVGTQTEITKLKLAESALRSSEERFRSAIESAPIGTALYDLNGLILLVNDALSSFLGYAIDELRGVTIDRFVSQHDRPKLVEKMEKVRVGRIPRIQEEVQFLHKDGHFNWGLLSVSLARDSDGHAIYCIAQIQDINDRKEMDRLKSEFISNVSHELRTPLTSIRGSIGLITGSFSKDIPTNVMQLLSIAHKNCERLILLINDILDLEKLSAEASHFDIAPHNLNEELGLAVEANQGYAQQFEVQLSLHVPDHSGVVNIDPIRFQQVLSNLISNAVKFSPAGGQVRLVLEGDAKTARILVSDDGPGIPKNFRSRIFEPFSQADASTKRQKGGTGLGLHIAKQMVEKMQGSLGFESVEGVGTTFWVEFPLIAAKTITQSGEGAEHHVEYGRPKALHVEDDLDFSAFIRTAVSGMVDVTNAPSVSEAKRLLATNDFDVLIIEVDLPDGSGLNLLDELPADNDLPVLILTAGNHHIEDCRVDMTMVKSRTREQDITAIIKDAAWWRAFGNEGRFTGVFAEPDFDDNDQLPRLAVGR